MDLPSGELPKAADEAWAVAPRRATAIRKLVLIDDARLPAAANPRAAYARILGSLDWPRRSAVEPWLARLPQYPVQLLAPGREGSASRFQVSQLLQI